MRLYQVRTPQRMLHEEMPMSVHIAFETPQDIKDSVFELVKLVGKEGNGTVKKGANEVTKCAERQTAMMVIMAEDVNPPELLAHIPMICKEKNYGLIVSSMNLLILHPYYNTYHIIKVEDLPLETEYLINTL